MPKGRRPYTKELYNRILSGYRTFGVNHAAVGRVAGVDRETAKRCYLFGWATYKAELSDCRPIKGVLEKEQLLARALRATVDPEAQVAVAESVLANSLLAVKEDAKDAADMLAKAAARAQELEAKARASLEEAHAKLADIDKLATAKLEDAEAQAKARLGLAEVEARQRLADLLAKAKVDAAETLADEANAAKFGRKAALAATAIAAMVLKDANVIAQQLRKALGDLSTLTPIQAIKVTREMVRLVEAAEKALILSLQAERLRVGQPTEVIGVTALEASVEEREVKAKAVMRAIERQKLKLVPGGIASGPEAPQPAQAAGAPSAGTPR